MDCTGQCSYLAYMGKSTLKQHTVYLDPDQHDLFMLLAQQTRIAQAVLLREAVDDLLLKHRMLEGSRQTERCETALGGAGTPTKRLTTTT
jgi:Ribbon-helix-helix domain